MSSGKEIVRGQVERVTSASELKEKKRSYQRQFWMQEDSESMRRETSLMANIAY